MVGFQAIIIRPFGAGRLCLLQETHLKKNLAIFHFVFIIGTWTL